MTFPWVPGSGSALGSALGAFLTHDPLQSQASGQPELPALIQHCEAPEQAGLYESITSPPSFGPAQESRSDTKARERSCHRRHTGRKTRHPHPGKTAGNLHGAFMH